MPDSAVPGIGVAGNLPLQAKPTSTQPPRASCRPFVRIELVASVCQDANDKTQLTPDDRGRWYRFATGCALDELIPDVDSSKTAVLEYLDNGTRKKIASRGSLTRLQTSDAFSNQSANITLIVNDLVSILLRRIRQMDRLRIILVHPLVDRPKHEWTLFDGFVKAANYSLQAGSGYSQTLTLQGQGLPMLLGGAAFNWQGFIVPDSDLFKGPLGNALAQQIIKTYMPCQDFVKAFIQSALFSSMGIKIGDWQDEDGIAIEDFVQFSETDWRGVPDSMLPLPWEYLTRQQPGASFWQIIQGVTEPYLHEFFCRYELPENEDYEIPVLAHRPLPFPGKDQYFDDDWKALPIYTIKYGAPLAMSVSEEINNNGPNCIHWSGYGFADSSETAFMMKALFGFVTSPNMINRFGFHSVEATCKVSTVDATGDKLQTVQKWMQDRLIHYAWQTIPTSLMRTRNLSIPFLPIRPGQVLEDFSYGAEKESCVTGYCTGTNFSLSASGRQISMRMDISLERCIWGTDAFNYPEASRALVPDITLQKYVDRDKGNPGYAPRVDKTPSKPTEKGPAIKSTEAVYHLKDWIKAASQKFGVPSWLIAHVLNCESTMGTNLGAYPHQGIAQITDIAATELISTLHHTNPDGSLFKKADRGDEEKCIHACARWLLRGSDRLNIDFSHPQYYSWVLRAYRYGYPSTNQYGSDNNWTLPGTVSTHGAKWKDIPSNPKVTDDKQPDYAGYWSPGGTEKGKQRWSSLEQGS